MNRYATARALGAAGLVLLLGSAFEARAAEGAGLEPGEKKFLMETAQSNMAEIKLGELAGEKAQSSEVKQFAEHLVSDHKKVTDKIEEIAEGNDVDLPNDPTKDQQMKADSLEKLSGAQFDKQFMDTMLKNHRDSIAKFEKQQSQTSDPEVMSFVRETLPTLRQHLTQAEQISSQTRGALR